MSYRNKLKQINANLESRSMSDGGPNNDFWNFSLEREPVSYVLLFSYLFDSQSNHMFWSWPSDDNLSHVQFLYNFYTPLLSSLLSTLLPFLL